jgi:hypothetical protein
MNNIFWTNSTKSGLCDRLIDLSLMSTLAKIKNSNLFTNWEVVHNGGEYNWDLYGQKQSWKKNRYEDYKFENFNIFFNFPKNVFINQTPNDYSTFNHYLGGVYSPILFHDIFLSEEINIDEFLSIFFNTIKEFSPTKELLDKTFGIEIPDLSIHLRREDKIRDSKDGGSINPDELDNLENITINFIRNFLSENKNSKIYISSDSIEDKKKYNDMFNKNIIEFSHNNENYYDTYIDIWLLSKSKNILMSQKHSNFSIFPSLLGCNNLLYIYDDCPIIHYKYNHLPNFNKI